MHSNEMSAWCRHPFRGGPATKLSIVIPTLNAASTLSRQLRAIFGQTLCPFEVLVADCNSSDGTADIARALNTRVERLGNRPFGHGRTRRWATELTSGDVIIFLTQDACPEDPEAFATLVRQLFDVSDAGMAYGRHMPYADATALSQHHRLYNYPSASVVKRITDAPTLQIKTCFASNSFAAYKRSALNAVGGFPEDAAFGEDVLVAAKMLIAGFSIVYAADAKVVHSHNLTIAESIRRYFSIGVFHGENWELLARFGGTTREGLHFAASEIRYLVSARQLHLIPVSLAGNALSWSAYWAGRLDRWISNPARTNLGASSSI